MHLETIHDASAGFTAPHHGRPWPMLQIGAIAGTAGEGIPTPLIKKTSSQGNFGEGAGGWLLDRICLNGAALLLPPPLQDLDHVLQGELLIVGEALVQEVLCCEHELGTGRCGSPATFRALTSSAIGTFPISYDASSRRLHGNQDLRPEVLDV